MASADGATLTRESVPQVALVSYRRMLYLRFRKNRLAVIGAVVLLLVYGVSAFADFFAPYGAHTRFVEYAAAPPQRLHLRDANGRIQPWPFVYGLRTDRDPRTLARVYVEDTTVRYPIRLFHRGDSYRFLFFRSDVHLFGAQGASVHLLGTDTQGRDLFSRIVHGGRISATVGLIGVSISLFLGIIIGMASGYLGGAVDSVAQRAIEVLLSFPSVPLWLALTATLPRDWSSLAVFFFITLILSLVNWAGLARVVRGMTLHLKHEEYVLSARMSGAGPWWIIARHLLPANLSYVIVSATLAVPRMILGETALSFLGLGLRPPIVSWGVLLKDAQQLTAVARYPWLMTPVLFVAATVLAFNFVGDGLRDAVDPHSAF